MKGRTEKDSWKSNISWLLDWQYEIVQKLVEILDILGWNLKRVP